MFDVIVIGGGIVGCSIIRELSKYQLNVLMLEKEEDVACGCSKANSGIVHAGYDAENGTLKAKFNVLGNKMYFDLAKELNVPIKQIGSLVLAKANGLDALKVLLNRGIINGVERLEILNREQLLAIEPNIGDDIAFGLYAPTAGIVSPYQMTVALAEQAAYNGVEVKLSSEVINIERINDIYNVKTKDNTYQSKILINASGYGADKISVMANGPKFEYTYARGDYFILDSVERKKFNHTCFPLPDERGKGILVSPTADGNVILGPTSISVSNGDDTAVTKNGLDYIRANVNNMMKNVAMNKVIRVFAGVRAVSGKDFIIEKNDKNLITVAGICSPGLTSAPAIGVYVAQELVPQCGVKLVNKDKFVGLPYRPVTRELTSQQWRDLINKDPSYAKIVCRCEKITEGEILAALDSPIVPKSLDALKRRVRTGMGRCQGGFCSPRVMEIVSKKLNIPFDKITKKGEGSEIVIGKIKEVSHNE